MRIRRFNESIDYASELEKYETLVDVLEAADLEDFKYIFPVEKDGSLVNPENGKVMTGPRILIKYIGYGEDDHPFVRNFKPMPDRGAPGVRKEIDENPEAHIHTFVSRRILYLINTSDDIIKRIHALTGLSLLFYRHEYDPGHGVNVVLDFGYYDESKYHFGISESVESPNSTDLEKYQILVDVMETTELDFKYEFPIRKGGSFFHPQEGYRMVGPQILIRWRKNMDHPFVEDFKRVLYVDSSVPPKSLKNFKWATKSPGRNPDGEVHKTYTKITSNINLSNDVIKRIYELTGLRLAYYNFRYEDDEEILVLNFREEENISESLNSEINYDVELDKYQTLVDVFDSIDDLNFKWIFPILKDGDLVNPNNGAQMRGPNILINSGAQSHHPFVKMFLIVPKKRDPSNQVNTFSGLMNVIDADHKNAMRYLNETPIFKRIQSLTGLELFGYHFEYSEGNTLVLNFRNGDSNISESIQTFDPIFLDRPTEKDLSDINEIFMDLIDEGKASKVECIHFRKNLSEADVIPLVRCLSTPGLNAAISAGKRGDNFFRTVRILADNMMMVYIDSTEVIPNHTMNLYKEKCRMYTNSLFVRDNIYKVNANRDDAFRYILYFLKNRKEIEDVINKTNYF